MITSTLYWLEHFISSHRVPRWNGHNRPIFSPVDMTKGISVIMVIEIPQNDALMKYSQSNTKIGRTLLCCMLPPQAVGVPLVFSSGNVQSSLISISNTMPNFIKAPQTGKKIKIQIVIESARTGTFIHYYCNLHTWIFCCI